jgi:succinate dehydrogenase / fumarate reductase, cytochrome b subunit
MKCSNRSRFRVSIVKKQVMAITGLLLCGFLVSHLLGNFLLFKGDRAFNTYAHTLITNPLIIPAEIILLVVFLVHLFLALKLTWENKNARPIYYHMKKNTGRGATFASNTMPYTGILILVFLIYHLINFKYGTHYSINYDGVEMRDLYKLLVEYFANPTNIAFYEISMIALGLHVSHGFWSAFQSLGFNHPRYNKSLERFSTLFAVVISLGYMSLPIYCYLQGAKL